MIYALFHDLQPMAKRASFVPLLELLECRVIPYHAFWMPIERRSWYLGSRFRGWGIRHYGSSWNWFMPHAHERLLSWQAGTAGRGDVVHFMMAEFGSPRHPRWFNRKGAKLVGTFHCSARRLPVVLKDYRCLFAFDRISVMSQTQIPYFIERGYPSARLDVTLHGVDCDYFHPLPCDRNSSHPLKLFLVGSTERDHEFAARVMKRTDPAVAQLDVLTSAHNQPCYAGLSNVRCLEKVTDEEMIDYYQRADLLMMPMLDCTANNAILESMACGTPVMANRVGGIPEYVSADSNFLFDDKDADQWSDGLTRLANNREDLAARRVGVRLWAETFDWRQLVQTYSRFYESALAQTPIPPLGLETMSDLQGITS